MVLDLLLNQEEQGGGTVPPPVLVIERDGKAAATVELDAKGRATVSFAVAVVSARQLKALGEMVEKFLRDTKNIGK